MALFREFAGPCRVLDLGGTPYNWNFAEGFSVTLLNLKALPHDRMPLIQADARCCPLGDLSFDVVFSNSVIEHVGGWEDQKRFANEVRRLAPRYFIQTPNKWFPIEPHTLAPFVQFVPSGLRPWASRWLTPVGWLSGFSRSRARRIAAVRLLSRRDMQELFPEARIVREKFLGLTKSLIAIR